MSSSRWKLCECGCGEPAPISPRTDRKRGYIKGEPRRFIHGHHARKSRPPYIDPSDPSLAIVPLTRGKVAVIDVDDIAIVSSYTWHAIPQDDRTFYARAHKPGGGTVSMHRVILGISDDIDVDHWDGDGLNNRRSNLRIATSSLNSMNQAVSRRNTSGYRGVSWNRDLGKYEANISINRRKVRLGFYSDPSEAARAYDQAARETRGEYATLNFPMPGERSARTGEIHRG